METPALDPAKIGTARSAKPGPMPGAAAGRDALKAVDYEALGRNLARMVEEGGKALAAYMKPREEGRIKPDLGEDFADMVKTIGQVADYWLSDPQRTRRGAARVSAAPISACGRARPGGWRARKRPPSSRPIRATSASPIRNGRRTSSSISSSRSIC